MNDYNIAEVKTLPDEPATEDFFGSHSKVADAISQMIQSEDGGKAIALTGTWGSGKSTVIELLKGNLSNNQDIAIFIYDAWVHQGDPLRRSFLESLVNFLARNDWIIYENWENKLQELSRRRIEQDITSEPRLTISGKLIAISLLFLPLGFSLFNSGLKADDKCYLAFWLWLPGLILSILPLLVALGTYLYWRPTWKIWKKDFWTKHRKPHENCSIFSLFINKTQEITKTTTIQTPDPTSLEFHKLFLEILQEALKEQKRRLVLVIDNLDRIPINEALSIWANIKLFFDLPKQNDNILSKLWIIVPFDKNSIKKLWDNSNTNEKAISFLKKTFQIEFYVPPTVLSDWKKYFIDKFREAFGQTIEDSKVDIIYRMFRIEQLANNCYSTPRDIKLFINNLTALYRQWQSNIPIEIQALFLLYKEKLNNPQKIIDKNFLNIKINRLIGNYEWQKYLAALYFNVPPEKALEVLIGQKIEKALIEGNYNLLEKYKKIPGFVTVCDHILEEYCIEWADKEPENIAMAALVIDKLFPPQEENLWRWIKEGSKRIKKLTGLNSKVGKGIVLILNKCSKSEREELARQILDASVKALEDMKNGSK